MVVEEIDFWHLPAYILQNVFVKNIYLFFINNFFNTQINLKIPISYFVNTTNRYDIVILILLLFFVEMNRRYNNEQEVQ